MNKPATPEHGVNLDLVALIEELRDEASYAREGRGARTLVRTPDLRVVLVVLAAGKVINEHEAHVTATVQTLEGRIGLHLEDRDVDVARGRLLVLGAGLAHDVRAHEDSAFLLTLGWRAERSPR